MSEHVNGDAIIMDDVTVKGNLIVLGTNHVKEISIDQIPSDAKRLYSQVDGDLTIDGDLYHLDESSLTVYGTITVVHQT